MIFKSKNCLIEMHFLIPLFFCIISHLYMNHCLTKKARKNIFVDISKNVINPGG